MPGKNEMEISGVIESIVFHSDATDYTVLELSVPVKEGECELITAVGSLPPSGEGECLVLRGTFTRHPEYGRQFSFTSYEKSLPKAVDDILKYLSSRTVEGVGPVTALKLVNRFGADTFEVMENHPEWLADIPGITMKKAAKISASFRESSGMRQVVMFCRDYLGTGESARVYKAFGAGAVGMIRENPYMLCAEGCGIPFTKVDAMAAALGYPKDGEHRLATALLHVLKYNADVNGHTCLPKEKLIAATAAETGVSEQAIADALEQSVAARALYAYHAESATYIMQNRTALAESYAARRIGKLQRDMIRFSVSDTAALIAKVEAESGIEYEALQRKAIFTALDGGIMILTGGPGTGKTTVVKAMLSIFESLGQKTVLCAPTGRAAKRMSAATGAEAKTIHRMLEMERSEAEEMRFNRNERAPLDESVVIVDEASMIDLHLFEALLRALRRGSRLILIGDASQLPSVGAGNVLADLIRSEKIPTVRLSEIFRQSEKSLIVTNAHKINEGKMPILSATSGDFFFVRREDEREIAPAIGDLIFRRLPKTYGASIRERIQVITPSRKGSGGVEMLNQTLRESMNPKTGVKREKLHHGVLFREGDRVMQTVNNYEIEWEKNGLVGTGIFNGDIGVIERIVPMEEKMIIRFDDRLADYPFEILEQLDLAYAITVHKSQGSEYPVVIVPVYPCAPMLMTRNLLYTAITRARSMVILVGCVSVVEQMVKNDRRILRYTTLCERIVEEAEAFK
ncbi:MAG: ATP-dependent RecD-like DNA helicase [Clostridia bacterium]|nr:ATP-dependent RecD-like DNA helicase [Clostridia bacterium]